MENVDKELLKEISDIDGEIKGAYNIRKNGKGIERKVTENVNIVTKQDKPGIDIFVKENTKFVRVYRESGKLTGGWVMEAEQIEGLTPSQIKNKFALEYEPKYICDVEIPAGSTVRYGIANKIINWGNGGGTQYDLMGQFIGKFTNERLL